MSLRLGSERRRTYALLVAVWVAAIAGLFIVNGFMRDEEAGDFVPEVLSEVAVASVIALVGVAIALRDGARNRRILEALSLSEERARALVELAPDGILVSDPSSHYVDANPAICRMLGYSRDELLAMRAGDLTAPDDPIDEQEIERTLLAAHAEEGALVERRYRRRDDTSLWAEVRFKQLPDGRLQRVIRDVEARRRAEQDRDRLAVAVEQAAESISIADADGMFVYANPAFEHLSGYRAADIVGMPMRTLRSGLHDAEFYDSLDAAFTEGRPWSGRIIEQRADGGTFELDLVQTPMHDAHGALAGFVHVGRDTTRERALEAELAQAQKMEAIGQLAGGIAHDFNNILTAIRGFAELTLLDLAADDPHRGDVLEIERAAARAGQLTRQLLAFGRRQEVHAERLDLGLVVAGSVGLLQRLVGEHIEVTAEVPDAPAYVMGDRSQIDQVLLNLAANARDAMPDGGALRLQVGTAFLGAGIARVHEGAREGPSVVLTVSDTGVGMDQTVRAHLFEPFYTTKEIGKGTGLGLASVYGIVKVAGGTIFAESEPGHGATFRIYLPALQGPSAAEAAPARLSDAVDGGGTEALLLVEDEDGVRSFAERVLVQRGYHVVACSRPSDALRLATEGSSAFDLLVTDVVMPELNGPALAAELARTWPGMPVLFVSGFGAGDTDGRVLPKPFTGAQLAEAVRRALDEAPRMPTLWSSVS